MKKNKNKNEKSKPRPKRRATRKTLEPSQPELNAIPGMGDPSSVARDVDLPDEDRKNDPIVGRNQERPFPR